MNYSESPHLSMDGWPLRRTLATLVSTCLINSELWEASKIHRVKCDRSFLRGECPLFVDSLRQVLENWICHENLHHHERDITLDCKLITWMQMEWIYHLGSATSSHQRNVFLNKVLHRLYQELWYDCILVHRRRRPVWALFFWSSSKAALANTILYKRS